MRPESKDHRLSHIWSHAQGLKFPLWLLSCRSGPYRPINYYPSHMAGFLEQTLDRQCQEWYSMCLSQIVFETGLLPFGWCWGNPHLCFLVSVIPFPSALSARTSWSKSSKGKTLAWERPEAQEMSSNVPAWREGKLGENGYCVLRMAESLCCYLRLSQHC